MATNPLTAATDPLPQSARRNSSAPSTPSSPVAPPPPSAQPPTLPARRVMSLHRTPCRAPARKVDACTNPDLASHGEGQRAFCSVECSRRDKAAPLSPPIDRRWYFSQTTNFFSHTTNVPAWRQVPPHDGLDRSSPAASVYPPAPSTGASRVEEHKGHNVKLAGFWGMDAQNS